MRHLLRIKHNKHNLNLQLEQASLHPLGRRSTYLADWGSQKQPTKATSG